MRVAQCKGDLESVPNLVKSLLRIFFANQVSLSLFFLRVRFLSPPLPARTCVSSLRIGRVGEAGGAVGYY